MTTTKLPGLPIWHEELHGMKPGPGLFDEQQEWVKVEDARAYGEACRATAPAVVGDGDAQLRAELTETKVAFEQARGMLRTAMYDLGKLMDRAVEAERRVEEATRPAPGRDGWIAVGERLPEEYEGVRQHLVYSPAKFGLRVISEHPSYWNKKDPRGFSFHGEPVTHWQPLPPAPRSES